MNTGQALAILRRHEKDLRARGVSRVAVFGSVARDESGPASDLDIMIETDPDAHITVFDYAGLKEYIAGLFDIPVDVTLQDGLKPFIHAAATTDAVYAF